MIKHVCSLCYNRTSKISSGPRHLSIYSYGVPPSKWAELILCWKKIFWRPPPHPHLKICIRHCYLYFLFYIRISRIHYHMIVTVRFLFCYYCCSSEHNTCSASSSGTITVSVVPPNDLRKLSGRESDPDSYLFRKWSLYRGSTVPKIDVNVIKWDPEKRLKRWTVKQFWLCLSSHLKEDQTNLFKKKGHIFVALISLKKITYAIRWLVCTYINIIGAFIVFLC